MDDLDKWKAVSAEHDGITRELALFVAGLRPESLPARSIEVLRQALVDGLGCGLYGLTTTWGRTMAAFAAEQGGPSESTLWCGGARIGAGHAALAAATAVHSFDFDDHSRAKIHPGAVVVPTALAMAERVGASGPLILTAMAAGYETMNRVSQASNPSRARMRGWHLTGTCGTFAAAATAAVLLRLDAETTASALGLAGTQSAGTWAFTSDGSMSKRMHPGRAAQDGITAALLAQRGFVGPRKILEAADGGFLFAMSDTPRPWKITEDLGTRWHTEETCFKPYACCGSNHACVDAAIDLVREHGLDADDIEHVTAGVAAVVDTQTGFHYRADSVLNAQMSLRYNVAVAICDGGAYLPQFSPERIVETRVCALAHRVQVEIDADVDRAYPEVYGGRLTVLTRDGRRFSKKVDYSSGMPENPMSAAQIEHKYLSLASAAVGEGAAQDILAAARDVFEAPTVTALAQRLREAKVADANHSP
jgi:2-methylcitrate dehydratase PrpD